MPHYRVIFLDRDGTIIPDRHFLADPDDIELMPGAAEGLTRLYRAGFQFIVVTNQSGIGRGLFTQDQYRQCEQRLTSLLAEHGIPVLHTYYCPHHPSQAQGHYRQVCACRKPKPGMIDQATQAYPIDMTQSFLIGDRMRDVRAGRAVGLRTVLVRSGDGEPESFSPADAPDFLADGLVDASRYILECS